jgi:protein-S-isoprenylcysteine O-methyltransferase Ste14
MGHNYPGTVWLLLSGTLTHATGLSISYTSIVVMGIAILLAILAALLRTWASAYLGLGIVQNFQLYDGRIVAAGPFRFVRNPLYLGLWWHLLALAVIMPPGGALVMLIASSLLIVALVHIEERHLTDSQGELYREYIRRVPRFLWAWRPQVGSSGERAHWLHGVTGELYMWGAVITYLALASRFNVLLLEQGLLISAGIAVLARGLRRTGSTVPVRQ